MRNWPTVRASLGTKLDFAITKDQLQGRKLNPEGPTLLLMVTEMFGLSGVPDVCGEAWTMGTTEATLPSYKFT